MTNYIYMYSDEIDKVVECVNTTFSAAGEVIQIIKDQSIPSGLKYFLIKSIVDYTGMTVMRHVEYDKNTKKTTLELSFVYDHMLCGDDWQTVTIEALCKDRLPSDTEELNALIALMEHIKLIED